MAVRFRIITEKYLWHAGSIEEKYRGIINLSSLDL
jgi:hypothetical protein